MKIIRYANMVYWLKKAERLAKKKQPPSDGSMLTLFYGDLDETGGHYQIEYLNDTRFRRKPWVQVFWWPKRMSGSGIAPYTLSSEEEK